jgi:hypothetical protein
VDQLITFTCLSDEPARHAVEMAEKRADDLCSRGELEKAWRAAREIYMDYAGAVGIGSRSVRALIGMYASWAAVHASARSPNEFMAACQAALAAAEKYRSLSARPVAVEEAAQCQLWRDIAGNPFRPVKVRRSWLSWGGGTVPQLAGVIDAQRRFEDLPVLADPLEEAGCTEESILEHCRSGGPHVRGCWVVDLLLAKS